MKINPYLLVALGVGVYIVGREVTRMQAALPAAPKTYPLPPLPTPDPIRESSTLGQWDSLGFAVDVFPPSGDVLLVPPPRAANGISSNPSCSVVVVGEDWWNGAILRLAAQVKAGAGLYEAADQTILSGLPSVCAGGEAYQLVREELISRYLPPYVVATGPIPTPVGMNARVGPGFNSSILSLFTGVRR